MLAKYVSCEQFGFLPERQIIDAIGITQECLHSIKSKKMQALILKLDLSKAYDRVNWDMLRFILCQIGVPFIVIRWIMACVTYTNYAVLVNGSPTRFFKAERGLRQGCPLSPLLFLLMIEGLNKMISDGKEEGSLHGINISLALAITHLQFVDDIVIFGSYSISDWQSLSGIFNTFSLATGMLINFEKSVLIPHGISPKQLDPIHSLFPARISSFELGLKYLGYYIKANNYTVGDWHWILRKMDVKINSWCNRYLSLGGRHTLLSSVLSGIPVYWFSLAQIPLSISNTLRSKMANFIWGHNEHTKKYHLVSWQKIFLPKVLGGWDIRQPYWFNIALCIKVAWRALTVKGLWHEVIKVKYMKDFPLDLWIRYRLFTQKGGSIFWRSTCKHFPRLLDGLAWHIGNGRLVRI